MTDIAIRKQEDKRALLDALRATEMPYTVRIIKGVKRSLAQNRYLWGVVYPVFLRDAGLADPLAERHRRRLLVEGDRQVEGLVIFGQADETGQLRYALPGETVEVANLPKFVNVEISMIAIKQN